MTGNYLQHNRSRGQSHVVGVALMLGLAVVALGTLTVGIGALVDSQAASTDAERVATDLEQVVQGSERTGYHSHQVQFTDGQLRTEQRTLRVLENGNVIRTVDIDAVVYENDEHRVTATAGALVRASGQSASLAAEPSITASHENEVLVVGAPKLDASSSSIGGQGQITATVETNVSHERIDLGTGEYAVAIETETPEPFERHFEQYEATVERETFDDRESVVVSFHSNRQAYLVVHDLQLEVGHG